MSAYFDRISRGLCGISGCENTIKKDTGEKMCAEHRRIQAERAAIRRNKKMDNGTCMYSGCHKKAVDGFRYCATHQESQRNDIKTRRQANKDHGLCQNAASHGQAKAGCTLCQTCIDQLSATSSEHYRRRKETGLCYYCNELPEPDRTTCKYHTAAYKDARVQLKIAALEAYGGAVCVWPGCQCVDPELLQLDHVDGHGNQHRRDIEIRGGTEFYQWLKANDYPRTPRMRVLCPTHNIEAHANKRKDKR